MKFTTESGSQYEIRVNGDAAEIRRYPDLTNPRGGFMRRDAEWLVLHSIDLQVGSSARMVTEPLGVEGVGVTIRSTTPVVSIEQ